MQTTPVLRQKYEQIKSSLTERARRCWAAAEARSIGRGGVKVRKWYESLPMTSAYQHKLKAAAMKEAVKYIGKADLAGAAEWLLQQPNEPWRPEEPFATVAETTGGEGPTAGHGMASESKCRQQHVGCGDGA